MGWRFGIRLETGSHPVGAPLAEFGLRPLISLYNPHMQGVITLPIESYAA